MTTSDIGTDLATTGGPSALDQFRAESGAPVGLEDVNSRDIVMSKITIEHSEGKFKDSLTGELFESLDTVLLGLIKGRVMWDPDQEAKDPLLCKSNDAVTGHPTAVFPDGEFRSKGGVYLPSGDGSVVECERCPFAQWGSHPKNKTSWCAEQMTFPLTLGPDQERAAGTVTFSRSGIKPTRAYLSSFVRERAPMFAYRTLITLDRQKNGSVWFATPRFVRGAPISDLDALRSYAEQYNHIRSVYGQYEPEADADTTSSGAAGVVPPRAAAAPAQQVLGGDDTPPF